MGKTKKQFINEQKMTIKKVNATDKMISALVLKGSKRVKKENALLKRKTLLKESLKERLIVIGIEIEQLNAA